ncbi:hypothetical protein AWN76_013165 [Rhodothermaceae bacterium RA]|nr:hypothetical protein AWN76_013165 [Rhodothermaceae bacterium RA]
MTETVEIRLLEAAARTADGPAVTPGVLALDSPRAVEMPTDYALDQNYPNPFNPQTTIRFALPEDGPVTLEVYEVIGRRVAMLLRNEPLKAGWHAVPFDARRLASGVYVYRLRAGDFVQSRKMLLVK